MLGSQSHAQAIASTHGAHPHQWLACPSHLTLTLGTDATMATPSSRLAVTICATKPGFVMFAPLADHLTFETRKNAN